MSDQHNQISPERLAELRRSCERTPSQSAEGNAMRICLEVTEIAALVDTIERMRKTLVWILDYGEVEVGIQMAIKNTLGSKS